MSVKPLNVAILAFALSIFASTAYCSDIMDDVIKLQRAGIDNEVILHYVKDSNSSTDLDVDEIQRLENIGVSSSVIVAMLDRAKELRDDPTKVHAVATAAPFAARPPVVVNANYNPDVDVVAPAEGHANISLFYEALSPYGTWTQDRETGWVWEPNDAVRDREWRPYANDGHWTWTNHGWYWESTSPYGWATFHYGRWGYNSNHRWSWSPDNVWGPAWVDWRYSDDYIGWAPLPFGSRFEVGVGFNYRGRNEGFDFHLGIEEREFSFVASNAFLNVNLGSFFVPERRRRTVYNETKIINNTYIYNDNRIINNGVPVAVVSRQTNRQIEQVKVIDANIAAGQPIRGDRRKDNAIAAYRPNIVNRASDEPPVIVARQKAAAADKASKRGINPSTTEPSRPSATDSDARQKLGEEKARLQASTGEERKVINKEVAKEHHDLVQAEQDARKRLQEEKQKRANGKATENKQNAAENKQNAEEKRNANQDAAKERNAENVSAREAQEKARDDAADARKAAAADREAKVKENQAAARDRKEDAVKEPKEKAREGNAAVKAEEHRVANEAAAATRKSNAEAEAKVRAEAAKERKEDAADAREAKEKARDEKREERKEKNSGKDK